MSFLEGEVSNGGTAFNVNDVISFDLLPRRIAFARINGQYGAKASLTGNTVYDGTGGLIVPVNANYAATFDAIPTLQQIEGNYFGVGGTMDGGDMLSFSISGNGYLTGSGQYGCEWQCFATAHKQKYI